MRDHYEPNPKRAFVTDMKLIDTDVRIDVQRGVIPALAWFESLPDLPVTSGFVAMELIQSAKDKTQLSVSMKLAESLLHIWPTSDDCRLAYHLFSQFHLSHGLGLLDSLIAATAVGNDATLFTFNAKHFKSVPQLKLSEPYVR